MPRGRVYERRRIGWCMECKEPIYDDAEKGVDYIVDDEGRYFHTECIREKGNYWDGFCFDAE